MSRLRILKKYYGILVKHPDQAVMIPAMKTEQVLQFLEDEKWRDVPTVSDSDSFEKVRQFMREWKVEETELS